MHGHICTLNPADDPMHKEHAKANSGERLDIEHVQKMVVDCIGKCGGATNQVLRGEACAAIEHDQNKIVH